MDPKQKFHRHFLDSAAELQDLIDQLGSISLVGGERQEATDHILAGIGRLQHEVSDAADFTPSYDRRQYSDVGAGALSVKGLQEKLNATLARITPKSRFRFRRRSVQAHVDMGAPENDPRLHPGSLSRNAPKHKTEEKHKSENRKRGDEQHGDAVQDEDQVGDLPCSAKTRDYNAELAQPSKLFVRKPSFSAAKTIGISNQSNLHILLPQSAARATSAGSLTDLHCCIVDMSVPTAQGRPFPGLALKNISQSLIIAGHVDGAVHITGVTDSIIAVVARQVRIHECKDVDVYVHCASHPIIEDCTGMRFAPVPECYRVEDASGKENQWDQVDDFKWLKAGQSPNWTTLSRAEVLDEAFWTTVVPGQPGKSVGEMLHQAGIDCHRDG